MGKWRTESATECGHEVSVHEDWDNVPKFCPSCKEERNAKWYEGHATECGHTIRICRDWDNVPRYCPNCKSERDAQWYEGHATECHHPIKIHRDWDKAPALCKDCKELYPPIEAYCCDCLSGFTIKSKLHRACQVNGYQFPIRCPDCRENYKLYIGALGALKERFPYALQMDIERDSLLGFMMDTLAVVRGRRDGNVVAEIAVVNGLGGKTAETRLVEGVGILGGRKKSGVVASSTSEQELLGPGYIETRTTGPNKGKYETRRVEHLFGPNNEHRTTRDGKPVSDIRTKPGGASAFQKKK